MYLFLLHAIISNLTIVINEDKSLTPNTGRVYFRLAGYHFHPDEITSLLGIEPTTSDASGAHSSLDKPIVSSWELSTEMATDEVDVHQMSRALLKQLDPVKDNILKAIEGYNLSPCMGVVLVLSVDKGESVPEVGFGARAIRFMADVGSFINVEYELSERI